MIEFLDVSKKYDGDVHALHHVSFNIEAGEFVFLIGESGAGKSTMIKLLTCEERPSSGTVVLDNFDVSRMKRKLVPFLRRKIGLIFQDFRLIESKTVFENVAFAMEIVGAPYDLIQRRVPIVLSVVGLRHKTEAYPYQLSGGEAQRVGVARAMVNNPRLILADEPTGNLDRSNGEAIMALLDEINRAGTTIIACTHDLEMVKKMNKRVLELSKGVLTRDEYPRVEDLTAKAIPVDSNISSEMRQLLDDKSYMLSDKALKSEIITPRRMPDIETIRKKITADSQRRKARSQSPQGTRAEKIEQNQPKSPVVSELSKRDTDMDTEQKRIKENGE